jgi:hypothetical protein
LITSAIAAQQYRRAISEPIEIIALFDCPIRSNVTPVQETFTEALEFTSEAALSEVLRDMFPR